jgi:probable rRNA maturation factor
MSSTCKFIDHDAAPKLKNKRKLSSFISEQIFQRTGKENHLTYIFCSDDYLLSINQQFLNHDTYTDIITFDLSEKKASVIESEIYISIDRVMENAKELAMNFQAELHRVIFHGALHLCGFKDKTISDKEKMRAMEDKWLTTYGIKLPSASTIIT